MILIHLDDVVRRLVWIATPHGINGRPRQEGVTVPAQDAAFSGIGGASGKGTSGTIQPVNQKISTPDQATEIPSSQPKRSDQSDKKRPVTAPTESKLDATKQEPKKNEKKDDEK